MSTQPLSTVLKNSETIYYENNFRHVLEQNLDYLKEGSSNFNNSTAAAIIPDNEAVACHGDFRKVCIYLNVPADLHWLTLRLNGLYSYDEYTYEMTQIMTIDPELISRLRINTTTTQSNI